MNNSSSPLTVELGERSYNIVIGSGAFKSDALKALCADKDVAIVADETVSRLYSARVLSQLGGAHSCSIITLPASEANKNWACVELLISQMLEKKFDRRSVLIALGGGVIGDITGFAAAVYQRGIDFIQMPTTLLAMVDSSGGGKTGVNHPLGKNMIGAFHQPQAVFADIDFLQTLPAREVAAGLAEIIKHGAIADVDYLNQVAQWMPQLLNLSADHLTSVIRRSCEIKAAVVAGDEKESLTRAILNFGHTFGHAIEAGMGYGTWLHGEAVGAGMIMAAELSRLLGSLSTVESERLTEVIASAGLPTSAPNWAPSRYLDLMSTDKKSHHGTPKFVVLNGLGQATLRHAPTDLVHQAVLATTK